jgi:hypothetical protein
MEGERGLLRQDHMPRCSPFLWHRGPDAPATPGAPEQRHQHDQGAPHVPLPCALHLVTRFCREAQWTHAERNAPQCLLVLESI